MIQNGNDKNWYRLGLVGYADILMDSLILWYCIHFDLFYEMLDRWNPIFKEQFW